MFSGPWLQNGFHCTLFTTALTTASVLLHCEHSAFEQQTLNDSKDVANEMTSDNSTDTDDGAPTDWNELEY